MSRKRLRRWGALLMLALFAVIIWLYFQKMALVRGSL